MNQRKDADSAAIRRDASWYYWSRFSYCIKWRFWGCIGDEVLLGLQQLNVGRAAEAGIAIVLLAIVLDRITQSYGETLQERTAPNTKKGK